MHKSAKKVIHILKKLGQIFLVFYLVIVIITIVLSLNSYKRTSYSYWNESIEKDVAHIVKKAIKADNIHICDLLDSFSTLELPIDSGKGGMYKDYPRSLCYQQFAYKTLDFNACHEIPKDADYEERKLSDICYSNLAEKLGDPAICENLSGTPSAWRGIPMCRAIATLDVSECKIFVNGDYDHLSYSPMTDCLIEIVKRNKDATLCEDIIGAGYGSLGNVSSSQAQCLKLAN